MMNETILVPTTELKESARLQVSKLFPNKEAVIISLPSEKRLPAPLLEIPLHKWIMPPEQHSYIQGNDKDCL